jgi:hypothetical protein
MRMMEEKEERWIDGWMDGWMDDDDGGGVND